MPEREPEDQVSRARAALAAAQADARARGVRPARPGRGEPGKQAPVGGAPGIGGDAPDPVPGLTGGVAGQAGGAPTAQDTAPERARGGERRSRARPGFPAQPYRAEPQPLGAAIDGLLAAEGWALAAATGSVFGRWAEIVGSDLAGHTRPEALSGGELTVIADSTAWATQVRLLAGQLVRRLNTELGDGTVQRVRVRGPVSGSRKPGEWRVRGGRGPRDTYG